MVICHGNTGIDENTHAHIGKRENENLRETTSVGIDELLQFFLTLPSVLSLPLSHEKSNEKKKRNSLLRKLTSGRGITAAVQHMQQQNQSQSMSSSYHGGSSLPQVGGWEGKSTLVSFTSALCLWN